MHTQAGMEAVIALVVMLIVLGALYWAGHRIAAGFGIPAPIMAIFDVILVLLGVFWLLRIFGLIGRIPVP